MVVLDGFGQDLFQDECLDLLGADLVRRGSSGIVFPLGKKCDLCDLCDYYLWHVDLVHTTSEHSLGRGDTPWPNSK